MSVVLQHIKLYGELVMFSHSLFALPFGLIGMLLASAGMPSWKIFFWILIALLGARNAANAVNRLIDCRIDARNPRTAQRHLPQGSIKPIEALWLTIFGFCLLILAAWQLNPLCLLLSPLAVFILVFYSYTKRFTWGSHLILGLACGLAPTACWLAVTGAFALPPLLLTVAVLCWVAGFDIIYATQDVEFDRKEGLQAIPARFGVKNALRIAKFLHFTVVLLLALLPLFLEPPHAGLGLCYYLGVLVVTCLLVWEHLLVKPDNLKKVTTAAYTVNQVIGVTLLLFTCLDVFIF